MPAIVLPNSREGEKPSEVPYKEDGEFFEYIMYFDGNRRIAYSDDPAELIDLLISGYLEMNEEERLDARLSRVINLQAVTQAQIVLNLSPEDKESLSEWELVALKGEYNETNSYAIRGFWKERLDKGENPEQIEDSDKLDIWTSEIPLVLIDAAYKPWSDIEPPLGNPDGNNIIWLRPVDETDFLHSLASINYITFGSKRNN